MWSDLFVVCHHQNIIDVPYKHLILAWTRSLHAHVAVLPCRRNNLFYIGSLESVSALFCYSPVFSAQFFLF